MQRFALACGFAVLLMGTASAADVYTGAKDQSNYTRDTSWTGPYIGIHGGWASGDWDGKLETTAGNPVDNYAGYEDPFRSLEGDGWNGGGQIGYNIQVDRFVFGVEVDGSWSDFSGSDTYVTDDYHGDYAKKHSFELDYFGTARVKVGVATSRFMPYVTGGLALGRSHGEVSISYPNALSDPGTSNAEATQNHVGWALGGGIETDIGAGWSLKAEYLYVDLGEQDYNFHGKVFNGAPFDTDSFDSDLAFDVFRAGLNYRF